MLGGKITAAFPYGDGPLGMPITDEKYRTWLMHCWLDVGDQALMGADMDVAWAPNVDKPKNGFDVTLHTDDIDEARRWFERLSEGGRQVMPFAETFWSPGYGALVDRFDVPWMVNTVPSADWKPPQDRVAQRTQGAWAEGAMRRESYHRSARADGGSAGRNAAGAAFRPSALL